MNLGIKVGLNNWRKNLTKSEACYCEVYYRLDKEKEYKDLFSYLRKNKISAGVHFWAVLQNGILANLAVDDAAVIKESKELLKRTIDLSWKHGFFYVNTHPESFQKIKADLDSGKATLVGKVTPKETGEKILLENVLELSDYAKKRGVLFLIETVPSRMPNIWWADHREITAINSYQVPFDVYLKLKEKGTLFANDFGHTMAMERNLPREILWQRLWEKTKILFKKTKLIHLNTTIPPFNGTDSHHGFLEEDFRQGAFPDLKRYKILLSLFKDRQDVFAIPEPSENHLENYLVLKKIIENL